MTSRGTKGTVEQPSDSRKRMLSERLRSLMDEQGLSVNELARRVQNELPGEKFNPVNLSHYRAGRSLPRPRYLTALSKAVGVPAGDLLPPETPPVFEEQPVERANDQAPAFHVEDLADGQAWLQINQRLPWSLVLKILQALKGDKAELSSGL